MQPRRYLPHTAYLPLPLLLRPLTSSQGFHLIRKNLLQLVFSGSCLWRWNDKLRPVQLTEIEKQAHKMIIAFMMWNETTSSWPLPERMSLAVKIIEGALFDYFYRLIITDIKPPVFYKIRQNPHHYKCLSQYVLARLDPMLSPMGPFWERMQAWHLQDEKNARHRRILAAAHLYASHWEFKLIQPHNPFDEEMDNIARSFADELETYRDLPGMAALLTPHNALAKFANLCGQLRFQIRWTRALMLPSTSVLGHMFIVAACAYLLSLVIDSCNARRVNNFFAGLFHDFPELLTRDIISPVKKSIPGLSEIIRQYEIAELERRVLSPLCSNGFLSLSDRLSYYLGLHIDSEFQECYKEHGWIIADDLNGLASKDHDKFDPKDGLLLKICDLLAAFLEAHNSIRNGVSTPHLVEARGRLKNDICKRAPDGWQLDALLADFD